MSLTVESTRFGTLEIEPEAVLSFPRGLIGLGGSRYALLDNRRRWYLSRRSPYYQQSQFLAKDRCYPQRSRH